MNIVFAIAQGKSDGKEEETVPLYVENDITVEQAEYLEQFGITTDGPIRIDKEFAVVKNGKLIRIDEIHNPPKKWFLRQFRKMLEEDKYKLADELGIPEIANDPKYRPNWLSPWQKKRIKDKKLTIKWIKTRLNTIKTILANAVYVVENSQDIEAALILCRKNFYHEEEGPTIEKHIFEKEHIDIIFEVLDNPISFH